MHIYSHCYGSQNEQLQQEVDYSNEHLLHDSQRSYFSTNTSNRNDKRGRRHFNLAINVYKKLEIRTILLNKKCAFLERLKVSKLTSGKT